MLIMMLMIMLIYHKEKSNRWLHTLSVVYYVFKYYQTVFIEESQIHSLSNTSNTLAECISIFIK